MTEEVGCRDIARHHLALVLKLHLTPFKMCKQGNKHSVHKSTPGELGGCALLVLRGQ